MPSVQVSCLLIEKIFEHARREPDKTAIYYHGQTMTYGQFAACIAHAYELFRGQDLRPGSTAVLVDVTSRPDAWALGIALRSLGLATASVRNPETFDEVGISNVGCVITTLADPALWANAGFRTIRIPQHYYLNNIPKFVPGTPKLSGPEGRHILLTSGTTGISKKVAIDATALEEVVRRRIEVCGISHRSIVNIFGCALWTGMGYYLPCCVWSAGGSMVFHQGSEAYKSLLIDGTTHAFMTPIDLTTLIHEPADRLRRNEAMGVYVTGGPITRALASAARDLLTPNLFTYVASTEVGPWTLTRVEGPDDLRSHVIEPSVEVQVVDDNDVPVPAGQVGAVRIRTLPGVNGYVDDEAASRAFFRAGYFYPGDLGLFRADGRLELRGRINNVINILGEKKPVEQLEQLLQDRLSVDGVCLLSRNEGEHEVVYVLIQSRRRISQDELAACIYSCLPPNARVVAHYVADLPRNDLGKINRAALAGWAPSSAVTA